MGAAAAEGRKLPNNCFFSRNELPRPRACKKAGFREARKTSNRRTNIRSCSIVATKISVPSSKGALRAKREEARRPESRLSSIDRPRKLRSAKDPKNNCEQRHGTPSAVLSTNIYGSPSFVVNTFDVGTGGADCWTRRSLLASHGETELLDSFQTSDASCEKTLGHIQRILYPGNGICTHRRTPPP